jgi:long-chain fatty acid transport protein
MKRACSMSLILAAFFVAVGLGAVPARAGGIAVYEMGTPDVGLATAGWAARAQDASTLFKNPAGMSFLPKSEVELGTQLTYGNVSFSPYNQTTTVGDNGPNPVGWVPGGSLFFVDKINDDLSVGMGIFNYFGAALNYNNTWVGRYYNVEAQLLGFTFMPAVSYRVNDWISVGAGLNATYGQVKQQVAVKNFDRADGLITYKDNEWGWGANVGVLVEPIKGTRIGVDYLSQIKLKFSDVPQYSGIGPGLDALLKARNGYNAAIDMGIYIPNMIMGSLYQEINPQWAVMANVGWQQWSKFGEPSVAIVNNGAQSVTVNAGYDDTWHFAGGVEYKPLKPVTFTAGMAYDTSAQKNDERTVMIPLGTTWRFGLGVLWQMRPDLRLGFAYEYALTPNMKVYQDRGPRAGVLSGEYDNFSLDTFAFNVAWQF